MPTVRAGIPHLSEVKTTAGPAAEITVQRGQYTDSGLFHPILKLPIVIVPTYPQPNTSSQKTKAIPQIESLAAGNRTLSFWPCRPSSSRTLSSPLSCACMEGSDTGVAASPLWLVSWEVLPRVWRPEGLPCAVALPPHILPWCTFVPRTVPKVLWHTSHAHAKTMIMVIIVLTTVILSKHI